MIQDNNVVAHVVFHAMKSKRGRNRDMMAIKLDMSKVYDRLEWGFLEATLLAYGF